MTQFLKDMFSSSACASFARVATLLTVLTGCWAVVYLVVKNHALPDPATLGALAFWMTSPYGINKVAGIFDRRGPSDPQSSPPNQ